MFLSVVAFFTVLQLAVGADDCQTQLDKCLPPLDLQGDNLPEKGQRDATCSKLKTFSDCMGKSCDMKITRNKMAEYMRELEVDDCPDLPEGMCENVTKAEECGMIFGTVINDFKVDDSALCPLLEGLERCLKNESKCSSGTARRIVQKFFTKNDLCSEIDLCNHVKEEGCLISMKSDVNCKDLQELGICLKEKADCNVEHINFVFRKTISDKGVDCEEINACDMFKEAACKTQLASTDMECLDFFQYSNCMNQAGCNQKFLLKDLEATKKELKKPCGICDEGGKTDCIDSVEKLIEAQKSMFDKCTIAEGLAGCFAGLGCPREDGVKGVDAIKKDLQCSTKPDDGMACSIRQTQCEDYIKDYTLTDKAKICSQVKAYEECIGKSCTLMATRQKMSEYMTTVKVGDCPEITEIVCDNMREMQNCEITYITVMQTFDMSGQECVLDDGLAKCLKHKGMCQTTSVKSIINKNVRNQNCLELVNDCDNRAEEECLMVPLILKKDPTCPDMKEMTTCLRKKGQCNEGYVRRMARNIMKQKKIECNDVNTCNVVKEEICEKNVSAINLDTTPKNEKCTIFKDYQDCMGQAECNAQHLAKKLEDDNVKLGKPCSSCSLLASIGLVFVMAVLNKFI